MLTTFYPPLNFGGDGIFVQALSRALVTRGHEVTVVHCADAFRMTSPVVPAASAESASDGVEVIQLRSRFGRLSPILTQQTGRPWLKSRRLQQILARGFHVVNFHNISLIGGPALLALPAGGARKVYTLHEHWLLCPTHVFWKNRSMACDRPQCLRCCMKSGVPPQLWRYGSLIRDSLAHVDLLIAPSEFTARRHREALPDGPPLLVNAHFSRLPPPPDATPGDEPYFLYVGRMTASKGIAELLGRFAGQTGWRLKVAGSGDLEHSLRERHAADFNIEFLGAVPAAKLGALYTNATAVIVPSLAPETFGLTVIEALSCGTPAIVRDAGGCGEIIRTTGAGYVFDRFDELPTLLSALRNDPVLLATLRSRARTGFLLHYTTERHVEAYLAAIQSLPMARRAGASE